MEQQIDIADRVVELRRVKASTLRPNPRNWRTHPPAQLDALRGVFAEIGIAGAEIVRVCGDGSLELIDGHARAEVLGDQVVPVLITDLTADEADQLLITYDTVGQMAGTDKNRLSELLAAVETRSEGLQGLWDQLAADAQLGTTVEIPEPMQLEEEAIEQRVSPNDAWQLGRHKLICGDANIFISSRRHDMLYTTTDTTDGRWAVQVFATAMHSLKPGGTFAVFHPDSTTLDWLRAIHEAGQVVRQCLVWTHSDEDMSENGTFVIEHEQCLYGWKKGGSHGWFSDLKQHTVMEFPSFSGGVPIGAATYLIGNATRPGAMILDPLARSETTIMACEALDRTATLICPSTEHSDLIIHRWEQQTGGTAQLGEHDDAG